MNDWPLVSILINNYNYGVFLARAIDSALGQSYPHIEVVVVDDGSSDDSQSILAGYEDRIVAVLKENGGQASAINAGFAASRGELICLLDADDLFVPHKVLAMVEVWRQYPGAVLYYHRMQGVDALGIPRGRPWPRDLWADWIRDRVERCGGWWPRPNTSALCFSRRYLERVLPMPEEQFRLCADAYVGDLAPFFGPVVGVPQSLTLYRQHGQNRWNSLLTQDRRGAGYKAGQYALENQQLQKALTKIGLATSLSLDHHLPYLMAVYVAEQKPWFWKIASRIWSCSLLSYQGRIRQLVKLVLKRF